MSLYQRGDVVVLPFPGSAAGSLVKKRPAVVLAPVAYGSATDYLCALVTSQPAADPVLVTLDSADVRGGSLHRQSYIRPLYLYTAGERLITSRIGALAPAKPAETTRTLVSLIAPDVSLP